jgi:hypothetical protein
MGGMMTGKNSSVSSRNPLKNQKWIDDLGRCIREQSECREYMDGTGLDQDGAWRGLCDWLMEECLIRLEMMEVEPVGKS